jgi:hypothetical protein
LTDEWDKPISFKNLPSEINPIFKHIPVAVNLFYGDPLLQTDTTVKYLRLLESTGHKGPVVIITKGDFRKFPDVEFDLDLHFAFSTFGIEQSRYDGRSFKDFLSNLNEINNRKHQYKYSIEFRPIINGVNDSYYSLQSVFKAARKYNLPVGYSGLQGKPDVVDIWEKEGYNFKPYPGYTFGHKKSISATIQEDIERLSRLYKVAIFRKTSCLISYVHNLARDYNAHYYRPSEMGCQECAMKLNCAIAKEKRNNLEIEIDIPFEHELIKKENHECILKQKGICEFPSDDCSRISGGLIKINEKVTTADVRVIKWLTGYTVDADFYESSFLSNKWRIK